MGRSKEVDLAIKNFENYDKLISIYRPKDVTIENPQDFNKDVETILNYISQLEKELVNNCKIWVQEEDIDYTRWFGLNELSILVNLIEKQQNKIENVKTRLEYYLMGNLIFNNEAQKEFEKLLKMLD